MKGAVKLAADTVEGAMSWSDFWRELGTFVLQFWLSAVLIAVACAPLVGIAYVTHCVWRHW